MLSVQRHREHGKEVWDDTHATREQGSLEVGNLVLLHNTKLNTDMSSKLDYKWISPYRIAKALLIPGTYILAKLDRTRRLGIVIGNRLKHFILIKNHSLITYKHRSNTIGILTQIY